MRKVIPATISFALLLSGCAGGGVGPLGLGAVFGDRNLASAEPLFHKKEDECLNSANDLLAATYAGSMTGSENCREFFNGIRMVLPPRSATSPTIPAYTVQQRNEIIDTLIAVSNKKCGRYSGFLKNADGIANVTLSLGSIIAGGLGAVVGGPATAKALSGSAAILSGSRAAINEVYLTNQTIHVLSSAFEKARAKKRAIITNRQACDTSEYTLMRGIEDAFEYHNSCSLVKGLEETVLAVERTDNPGLDAMRKTLSEYAMLVKQASEIAEKSTPTPVASDVRSPILLDNVIELDKKLVAARADIDLTDKAIVLKTADVEAAKTRLDAETDEAKKLALAPLLEAKTSEKLKLEEARKEQIWKRDGLSRDLQRAAQLLASAAIPTIANVSLETRVCPFRAMAPGKGGADEKAT